MELGQVLANELIKRTPVVVAADATVLPLDRGRWNDFGKVAIVRDPDLQEGVDLVGGAPTHDPRI